jgi:hypothetical protein
MTDAFMFQCVCFVNVLKQFALLNTVTRFAVDVVQYVSADRTIKLAPEVAKPWFHNRHTKGNNFLTNLSVRIAVIDSWTNELFCRMVALCRLSAGGCTPPTAARMSHRDWYPSQSVQSKGRQDRYRSLASTLSDTASYGKVSGCRRGELEAVVGLTSKMV